MQSVPYSLPIKVAFKRLSITTFFFMQGPWIVISYLHAFWSITSTCSKISARQCCYDEQGVLVSGPGGGHADYFSPWTAGVNENKAYWEHFLYDIIPFLHCCKAGVRMCDVFYSQRPSTMTNKPHQCLSEAPTPGKCMVLQWTFASLALRGYMHSSSMLHVNC